MKRTAKIALFLLLCLFYSAYSQKDDVNKYLRYIAQGQTDEVRNALPELLAQYPNDPGVMLLQGAVLEDGMLAMEVYNRIVKDFPESEWADDAYWRIVQFYAVLGDTLNSRQKLDMFRSRYPLSPFLAPASDVVHSALMIARSKKLIKPTDIAANSHSTANAPIHKDKDNITKPHQQAMNTETPATPVANNIKTLPNANNNSTKVEDPKSKPLENTQTNISPTPEKEAKPAVDDKVFYGLQVGIYKDKSTAENQKKEFLARRLRTEVVDKQVNGVVMFAVVIGNYSSAESAESAKRIVKQQCGCDPIIYKK